MGTVLLSSLRPALRFETLILSSGLLLFIQQGQKAELPDKKTVNGLALKL